MVDRSGGNQILMVTIKESTLESRADIWNLAKVRSVANCPKQEPG
jgi:hypothetical protein